MKSNAFIHVFALVFVVTAAFAGPVQNADFEQALGAEWAGKDLTVAGVAVATPLPPARVAGTRTDGPGAWVIETTGRDHAQDGPLQGSPQNTSLMNTLASASYSNGRTYTTRVWVKLDPAAVEASFRCVLRWRDNGVDQVPLLLAEAAVLQPGVWVQATGTAKLQWVTSLTAATIDFEVEQLHKGGSLTPPPQWFPSFQIDDLQMELDGDGDGLWDDEESSDHTQAAIPFSDNPDSDGDRIPDDYERAHPLALNARDAADAFFDFDHDEWTNLEEYIGATDPADAASRPGEPSDPEATLAARALLRYLVRLPATQRHLVGQMVSDLGTDYGPYVDGLANLSGGGGRYPAILGLAPESFTAPVDFEADAIKAAQFVADGGIVTLNWALYNPWVKSTGTYGNANYIGTAVDDYRNDIPGLLDENGVGVTTNSPASNLAARAAILSWCDQVAALLKQHLPGVPVLMRPLHEMNGGWFWYGHRTRAEYVGLWNLVRDRFVHHHEMHNLLWVCSAAGDIHGPSSSSFLGTSVEYYYPGDAAVDIVGAHFYDNFKTPVDIDRVWARHPKVFAMPEYGADRATRYSATFDNLLPIETIRARMPRAAYFTAWSSWTNSDVQGGPMTHKYIAIAENPHAAELLADDDVVTRDEIAFMPPTSMSASAASATSFAVTWTNVTGNSGYRIETSTTNARGSWTPAADTAANANAVTIGGFAPATTLYFRVSTLFGNGDDTLGSDGTSAATWSLYQQWKSDWLADFNAPDLADDDGDGQVSMLEYGLGTNPLDGSSSHQPALGTVVIGGADYLALTFRRRAGASGISYSVEATSDLMVGPWHAHPVQHGGTVDNGDGTEMVTFRDLIPMSGVSARFLRLRVSAP